MSIDQGKPPATILVVDDSRTNLLNVSAILAGHYRVLTASSGQQALELAKQSPHPDLILLDVVMPNMDGYEVISQLRADAATQNIPVIFVTGKDAKEDEQKGLTLGAVDYMTKPLRPDILLARLHNHLELKASRDALRSQNAILESRIVERTKTLQAILDSADQLIVMILPEGGIMAVNRAGARRLGSTPSNLVGRSFYDFLPTDLADQMRRHVQDVVADGSARELNDKRDGQTFRTTVFPVAGKPPRVVIYAVDITDYVESEARLRAEREQLSGALAHQRQLNTKLEEAQNQLLQSEKMASLGQLAAGVAHELNNPIGFVHSNLGTLENYLKDIFDITKAFDAVMASASAVNDFSAVAALKKERDFDFIHDDIFTLMTESKDGLQRIRKIVQNLKDFSHVGDTNWTWADVHVGLESTLTIVWNELKYKCQVIKNFAPDLPRIYCLPSQLNQVFMNLLVNAAQAIETRGDITISTAREGEAAISISIRDTGQGIAEDNMKKLFEPFFTTKPVGKGTGLGLSIAYGIINKHHGTIRVESQLGVGTTFRIVLPIEPIEPTTLTEGSQTSAKAA